MKYANGWRAPLVVMCCLLVLQPVYGQEARLGLKIVVVEGANAKNVTQEVPLRPLTVRIAAGNNQSVPNATVIFTSPETGASGEFANDSRTFSVTTGDDGLATARGYHPNAIAGSYAIRVRAIRGNEIALANITQRNVTPGQGGFGKRIAIVAIAAAAVGAVLAARSHSSSSPSPSNAPTITLGGGAVGAPR